MPHRPYHHATGHRNDPQSSKKPSISDSCDEWLRHNSSDARENVTHKVIDCDAGGGFAWHEFGEHSGCHGEDEHATDAEEEVCDELDYFISHIFAV